MTINFRIKHVVIFALIMTLCISAYTYRDSINSLFVSGAQKSVNKALLYFNSQNFEQNESGLSLFGTDFTVKLLMKYPYYKVEGWKLLDKGEKDGKHIIFVDGTTVNGFGAKLERKPIFVVEKIGNDWIITDTYDLFVFDKIHSSYSVGKSDMGKSKMMEDLKEKVIIEKWGFESTYGNSIKGEGTVANTSEIPVSFVKLQITYYDRKDNITNSDETYAISDELLPGQKRTFEWYTSSCYQCNRATIQLKFD